MENPQLGSRWRTFPMNFTRTTEMRSHPITAVPGKPATFIIEGLEIGPEFVFSSGKELTQRQRRLAIKYLTLRDGSKCMIGDHAMEAKQLDGLPVPISPSLHHLVKERPHVAKLMQFACSTHNPARGQPTQSLVTQERKSQSAAPPQASSMETAKHDPQRAAWDAWIESDKPWKLMQELNLEQLESMNGRYFMAQDLAELAVSQLIDPIFGKGSSETYMRYAREDRFSSLEMLKDKGRWWVKQRKTVDKQPLIPQTEPPREK